MKLKTLFAIFIGCNFASYGQNVGIGTSSPAALLDVYSAADGVLIPRVALTGTGSASPLSSPTVSTLVYNTATAGSGATAVSPGFYYWNGSAWVAFIDNSSLTGSTTVSNTSTDNTLGTTVNGVTGTTVPLINTNVLGLSGTTLTSTINGVASNGQDLSSLDNNIYNSDGTLTGPRTVTMSGNVLDFAGGKVGINTAGPYNLFNIQPSSDASPGSSSSYAFGINGTSGYNNITMGSDGSYAYLQSWQSRPLQINSQGNNVLFPSGNVGIGTTNASSMLTVNGKTSTTNFQMTNGSTANYVLQSDASGNASWVSPSSIGASNSLSLSTNTLTSTVNGVAATSPAVSGVSNTSSANTISTTVNGVTGSTVPIVNSISNTSSANTLSTTVNGVISSTVPIINSNALGLSGTTLTSTINGLGSNTLDISSVDKNIYNTDGTLTGARTVTMAGNTLNFTGGNVGIGGSAAGYTLDLNSGTFAFGAGNMRTETRTDAGLQGNAGAQSGFYQNDGSTVTDYPSGASGWWHMIDCRHSNSANNYAMQFAGSFFDQNLYFRKTNNSASQAWSRVMTSNDVSGTTNYISKFTSANTVGNSVITDDGNTVVFNPPTYTYFQSGSVYAQNLFIARGGVYNDGGNLALSASGGAVTVNNQNFDLNSRSAIQDLGDGWERLNQNSSYSNGTYTPGFFRADGGIASGGLGSLGGGTINASGTIATTGSIGVGTTSPSQSIHTTGYVHAAGFQCHNGSSGASYGNIFNFYWSGSSEQAWIDVTDVAGSISDRRLKSDITELKDNGINRVMALRPVSFKFKKIEGTIFTGSPDTIEGFIADEVQQVIPSAVNHKKDELTSEGTIQPQSLNMPPLVSVLTKAVQEQQVEIESLKIKIEELQKLIEAKHGK